MCTKNSSTPSRPRERSNGMEACRRRARRTFPAHDRRARAAPRTRARHRDSAAKVLPPVYCAPSWTRPTPRATSKPGSTNVGKLPARSPPRRRRTLLHHAAAAERHRHAAHGPRVPAHPDGHADALAPHARRRDAVAAGHGPRGHRDADGRRAPARRGRQTPPRPRPRSVRRARVEVEGANPAARSRARCAGSAPRSTGRATSSRWIPTSRAPCTEAFVRLHDEGLIYRGKRLVNWDPVLQTAVSDLEVRPRKRTAALWHSGIRSPAATGYVVVATTRPETMLGDTAVAVNPGRRALPRARRQATRAAADRPQDPGDRRRLRRRRVRHRAP